MGAKKNAQSSVLVLFKTDFIINHEGAGQLFLFRKVIYRMEGINN